MTFWHRTLLRRAAAAAARSSAHGASAIARPWRAGAGAGDFARRQGSGLRQLRHLGDPLVADAQRRRAGDALPRQRGERGRLAQRWPHRHRRRRRAYRDLDAGQAAARHSARRPQRPDRRPGACRRTASGSPRRPGITPCGCGRSPAARRACSKAMRRTSTASPSRPTAAIWSAPAMTPRLRIWRLGDGGVERAQSADAAQFGGGRARRRDRRGRRRRQGLFPVAAGRAARRRAGVADADHRGGDFARRQAGRRRRHSRLGGDDRAQDAQARAHAGRARPAGVVGGVLSRQPHVADRRHRPHDPPLGRGHRRADRRASWSARRTIR